MTRHLLTAIAAVTLGLGAASPADAQELVPQLEITFDTNVANAGGQLNVTHWRPRNVVAVWVTMLNELEEEVVVKTVHQSGSGYTIHLLEHNLVAPDDLDGISGATRIDHQTPVVATWDLTDQAGDPVEPGLYTIHAEIVDCNANDGAPDCEPTYALFDYELLADPIEDPTPQPQEFIIQTTNAPAGTDALENATTQYQLVAGPEEDEPGTGGGDGSGGGNGDGTGGGSGEGVTQDGRDPTVTAGCSATATSATSGELAGLLALCGLILAFGLRRRDTTRR